jgi:glycine cleavage system H protein
MKFPNQLHYTAEHLWVRQISDEYWLTGITDYAQDLLGDIVFIDPPKIDDVLINGTPCGLVESVKTGSDLHAPMDGIVIEINKDLLNSPEVINDKPYEAWIFKFKPNNINDTKHLLSANAYKALVNLD